MVVPLTHLPDSVTGRPASRGEVAGQGCVQVSSIFMSDIPPTLRNPPLFFTPFCRFSPQVFPPGWRGDEDCEWNSSAS